MNLIIDLALIGFIPFALLVYAGLPPRRAVVVLLLTGWLFLPQGGLKIAGLPAYSKATATCGVTLLGSMLFDLAKWRSLRLRWFDLPVVILCLCPLASSISMELGVYDGISASFAKVIIWGCPYVLGRLYFADSQGLRELALGIVLGGLAYVPLCLLEIRMSPILAARVYGLDMGAGFLQTIRYGGYRPVVFMQHGLAVAAWMASASLVATWLWMTGAVRNVWRFPMGWIALTLILTAVMCKSTGAIALLAIGATALVFLRVAGTSVIVWGLIVLGPLYIAGRLTGVVAPETVLQWTSPVADKERIGSVRARLVEEDLFSAKAMQRPAFGWTGWYFFPTDENGQNLTRGVDGAWIVSLGTNGLTGLIALILALLTPPILYLSSCRRSDWCRPETAAVTVLMLLVVLHMVDDLQNGMHNVLFVVVLGGGSAFASGMRLSGQARFPFRVAGSPRALA